MLMDGRLYVTHAAKKIPKILSVATDEIAYRISENFLMAASHIQQLVAKQ